MNFLNVPVLELTGIHKVFPGVKALSEAGLRCTRAKYTR